jgi:DNA-nicking Smr family endonuclease
MNEEPENGRSMAPVRIPITDELDLHTFLPREVPDLIDDYLAECRERGIREVRIIHGKGSGTLRRRVHALLDKHPLVRSFQEAPPEAGGWGATLVWIQH